MQTASLKLIHNDRGPMTLDILHIRVGYRSNEEADILNEWVGTDESGWKRKQKLFNGSRFSPLISFDYMDVGAAWSRF